MTQLESLIELKRNAQNDKEFLRFLKERNILIEYFSHLQKYILEISRKDPLVKIKPIQRTEFISSAFPWIDTKEGPTFWLRTNDNWYRTASIAEQHQLHQIVNEGMPFFSFCQTTLS